MTPRGFEPLLPPGKGHEIVDSEEEAEVIVINTCCFIHDAKEESVENILEMAEYKKAGTCKVLIVTGCMAQRYKEEIIQEIPEVDAVLGTTSYMDILKAIDEACEGRHFQEFRDINELPEDSGRRVLTTGGHYGYLKIAEGCDKHCTYCIIPSLRGRFRSVPQERLIAQAEHMAEQGDVYKRQVIFRSELGQRKNGIFYRFISAINDIWSKISFLYLLHQSFECMIQMDAGGFIQREGRVIAVNGCTVTDFLCNKRT